MRKTLYILTALVMTASMLLAACGTGTTETTVPDTAVPAVADTATPEVAAPDVTATPENTATPTAYPTAKPIEGRIPVRWFIGLGTGTDAVQLTAEQSVVDDFNAAPERDTDKIQLIMEVVPFASAKDTVLTEIAAGNGPDVIGPVGWSGSNSLFGQWLDLTDRIKAIPDVTADFDPALLKSYESSEGQVGLPFAVYPSAIFYNSALFDEAGLSYPPAKYGDKYKMPDGKMVDWSWDTVKQVSQWLTVDSAGKNATEDGFDKTKIVQYGWTWNFETQPSYLGTFWANGSYTAADGKTAQLPDAWKESWAWSYDGMWGDQPFIPNGQVSGSADFGNGNPFNSGKVAMVDQPVWYLCCLTNVKTWDAGAMPSYKGKANGRIDADTFRIWKGTKNPDLAFTVLTYLVTTGVQKLIIGSKDMPAAYGALPARAKDAQPWIDAKKAQFPQVKNWDVVIAGLSHPDSPSAESYMPNFNEAWDRGAKFYSLMANTAGLDLAKEEATFLTDLQAIFDKK